MDLVTYLRGVDQEDYQEQLNQTLRFNLGNNGFLLPNVTNAGVTEITNKNYVPVLPVGTTWFNTDVVAPQVITVAAVPGTSNATIMTYTIS